MQLRLNMTCAPKKCLVALCLMLMITTSIPARANIPDSIKFGVPALLTTALLLTYKLKSYVFSQEQTLELPEITYKKITAPNPSSTQTVRLIPQVSYQKILKKTAVSAELKLWKTHTICDPIRRVKNLNHKEVIQQHCMEWFQDNELLLPHEYSQVNLSQNSKIVLPEIVFIPATNGFRFNVAIVEFQGKKPLLGNPEQTHLYLRLLQAPGTFDANFKTCHFTRDVPSMNEAKVDSDGNLYYQFMLRGISHLHHHKKQFLVATPLHNSGTGFKVPYWIPERPWPREQTWLDVQKSPEPLQPVSSDSTE